MNTYFTMTLLSSAVLASADFLSHADQQAFIGYAAHYNKHYNSVGELEQRRNNWLQNRAVVDYMNRTNVGVSFELNSTGDLNEAEYEKKLGLKQKPGSSNMLGGHDDESEEDSQPEGGRLGTSLTEGATSVNWVDSGNVTPVKNQGDDCGSCWVFSATLGQEAMQSIQTGQAPVRLSEQEGVDCVVDGNSWGCDGGLMEDYWDWNINGTGSQAYDGYPYEAIDGNCRNQNNTKISKVDDYYFIDNVPDMLEAIQEGPLVIGVVARGACWRFYKSGVLSSANNCPSRGVLDHGVVIVGVHIAEEDASPTALGEQICRRATRRERRNKECDGEDEVLSPNRRGRPNRRCCTGEPTPEEDQDYWIIQNSLGTEWGNNGFINIAVEGGRGVSGVNREVWQLFVDPDFTG